MNQTCQTDCSNKHECTCPEKSCPRNGKCCDCIDYHRSQGDLPMCLRK